MESDIVARDFAERSADVSWPKDFTPADAGYFSHNTIIIAAPLDIVWSQLVAARGWPEWFFLCKEVVLDNGRDALTEGASFRWITSAAQVKCTIDQFVPKNRLTWYGAAPGKPASVYHAWHLSAVGDACHVVYDEVVTGDTAALERAKRRGRLHQSHDLWLAALKWVCEEEESQTNGLARGGSRAQ